MEYIFKLLNNKIVKLFVNFKKMENYFKEKELSL